jgi:transposase-like protein
VSHPRRSRRSRVVGWDFRPPHCPNRDCTFYTPQTGWTWRRTGSFRRPHDPTCFQCFQCPHCGRYFSVRTFAGDYWLKRRDLLQPISRWAPEGPGLRQTARQFGVSHATVQRHLARAGRQALLFHRMRVADRPPCEPIVLDGFETFEFSQYFPFHLNLAVGAESWFLYGFTDSPLRRKGRMTATQKRRRAQLEFALGRPDPKAVETGVMALIRPLLDVRAKSDWVAGTFKSHPDDEPGRAPQCRGPDDAPLLPRDRIRLHSDDHPAYVRALRRLEAETGVSFDHRVTSSRARRTTSNPLFPVNLADLLLRHGQANHRRETIAFSKRRQGAISRAAVFLFWRNYVKRRREKRRGETAAMAAGYARTPLGWEALLRERKFPRRSLLPGPWWDYYWHRVRTEALGDRQTEHRLKFAF